MVAPAARVRQFGELLTGRHAVLGQGPEIDLHVSRIHGGEIAVELGVGRTSIGFNVLTHGGVDALGVLFYLLRAEQ